MDWFKPVLEFCGSVSIIGGAIAVVWKLIYPAFKLSKRVNIVESHQNNDYKRLEMMEKMQRSQSKAMAAMLNHMIDGNGKEKMKSTRKELLEAIIEN